MREFLKTKLDRELTFTLLKHGGVMVDYICHDAPAKLLVGANEDEAVEKLYSYFLSKPAQDEA